MPPSSAVATRNLERSSVKNAPTTMTKIQNRLHELDGPISGADLARDLGITRGFCRIALDRLVAKGLVVRHQRKLGYLHWSGRGLKGKPKQLRRTRLVWFYEILQEK